MKQKHWFLDLNFRSQEGPLLSRRDSRSCPERRRARSEQSRLTGPRRDRSRSSGFEERREEGSEFGRTHHKYLDMPTVETENEVLEDYYMLFLQSTTFWDTKEGPHRPESVTYCCYQCFHWHYQIYSGVQHVE